ncbi:condensation domain-containing protein, partial [Roseateles flavus]
MNIESLLQQLQEKNIQLHIDGEQLLVRAPKGAMNADLAQQLKLHKAELLEAVRARLRITPDMLPLVQLSQDAIDGIVAGVEGGAANVQDIYPLAPLQEGILFHHLMETEGDAYLLPSLYRFKDRARLDRFLEAVQGVIKRHDILRTGLSWDGLDQPVQVVRRQVTLPVEELQLDPLQGEPASQLEARLDPRRVRLDLRQAPLLRCYIAADGHDGRWLLRILAHHLAVDHTTMDLLVQEAMAIERGEGASLPPPVPFRNFIAQARLGARDDAHEAFFKRLLSDIDGPTAPFGLLDVRGDGSRIAEARLPVSPAMTEALRSCVRRLGVSMASVAHLAWSMVLARTSGRHAVVFGTVLFGRMHGGTQVHRALGMFINTLPFRMDVNALGVERALKQAHRLMAELLGHEQASLALAQRCSGVDAQTPLFSSLLNFRHSAVDEGGESAKQDNVAEAQAEDIEDLGGHERTNYPLTLSVDDFGPALMITAQVQEAVDPERVCRFVHRAFEVLLEALTSRPETPLASLDVLPSQERAQLLGWGVSQREYPREEGLAALFARQVQARAQAV